MKKLFIIGLILLTHTIISAQSVTAFPFLRFTTVPQNNAFGGGGTGLLSDDPGATYFNPALAARIGNSFISASFIPGDIEVPYYQQYKYVLKNRAFGINYCMKKYLQLPITIGLNYNYSEIDFGEFAITDIENPDGNGNKYRHTSNSKAFTIAVGYDWVVDISLGLTFKSLKEEFVPNFNMEGNAVDYGIFLNAPISNYFSDLNFVNNPDLVIRPQFGISLGFASLNNGDDAKFTGGFDIKDPLPATYRLGYSFYTSLELSTGKFNVNLIDFKFTVDANDLRVESDGFYDGSSKKRNHIRVIDQLFGLTGSEKVILHKGIQLSLFDTFGYSYGIVDGHFYNDKSTDGINISSKGLFNYLGSLETGPTLNFFFNHIELNYVKTKYPYIMDKEGETYSGLSIKFKSLIF